MRTLPVYALGLTFVTPPRRGTHLPGGVLPAEFGEAVVVDAEVVGDLVHHRPPDLVGDLLLGAADGADLQAVDGDPVGQYPGVVRGALGERDALVEPEQAGRTRVVLDDHRDVAHQPAEIFWQPVQRGDDHVLETARLDVDHQSQRRALLSCATRLAYGRRAAGGVASSGGSPV